MDGEMDGTFADPNGATLQQQDEFPDSVVVVSLSDTDWWSCPMQHACVCSPDGTVQSGDAKPGTPAKSRRRTRTAALSNRTIVCTIHYYLEMHVA